MLKEENTIVARLEEYKALRKAIFQEKEMRIRLLSLAIPAVGLIIGLSINIPKENLWIVSLALFMIIDFCAYMTVASELVIRSIGSYIKVVIEKQVEGLLWESLLPKYEKIKHKIYIREYIIVYSSLGIFSLAFSLGMGFKNILNTLIGVSGFLLLSVIVFRMIKINHPKTRDVLTKQWEDRLNEFNTVEQ